MAREIDTSGETSKAEAERVTRARAREQQEAYEASLPESPVSPESVRGHIPKGQAARTIVGTMAATTVFALISTEISGVAAATASLTSNKPSAAPATNGVRIILGGGVATILLLLIAEVGGDAGAELAQGLAVVALVTVTLVKGKPVWDWANKAFGGTAATPTTPTGTTPITLPDAGLQSARTAPTSTTRVTAPTY